jgi:hypothetical protein
MKIGFFIYAMNLRGVAYSIFKYAYYNETILKNKSYIFFDKSSAQHEKRVINKFKKNFNTIALDNLEDISTLKNKIGLDVFYTQIGKFSDYKLPINVKNFIHLIFPQPFYKINHKNCVFISKWLSRECSNYKFPHLPFIINYYENNANLRKQLKINDKDIVFGCHGGAESFDIAFVKQAIFRILKKRSDIFFLFLNINKFANHPNIIFLKGTLDDHYKVSFINTCDAMLHGRSLGESFGIACAEFAIRNKPIFTYKFSRDRAHIHLLKKKVFLYSSENNLFNLINTFNKNNYKNFNSANLYKNFSPEKVMNKFKNIYSKRKFYYKITFVDYLFVFLYQIKQKYYYIRHKIYHHYFNFFRRKDHLSFSN